MSERQPPEDKAAGTSTDKAADQPIGQMVGGKYELLSVLGEGGMGTVYRVRQVFLNSEMALKLLSRARINDSVYIRRFQQEAKAAFSLDHPCLVKVHDYGLLDSGQPYLVMDLVEGETLSDYLKREKRIPLQNINAIFAQVCFALSYAHGQKVVHRDIKPGNIMLVRGQPLTKEGSVKIVDFGLAKIAAAEDAQTLTRTGELIGSPIYMSPEQCSSETLDHRSDIYSLGCVLFEALTGRPPFIGENSLRTMLLHQGSPPPTLKEASSGLNFPPVVEAIVAKMLAKSPEDRYQDLGIVAHEFSHACSGSYRVLEPRAKPKTQGLPPVMLTRLQLALSIACTMLVSVGLTAFAMTTLVPPSVFQAPQPPPDPGVPVTHLQDDAKIVSSFESGKTGTNVQSPDDAQPVKPIKSKTVTLNGTQFRQLDFPGECFGEVSDRFVMSASNYNFTPYKGRSITKPAWSTQYFPVNVPLTLKINLAKYPSFIRRLPVLQAIGPDEFEGLALKQGTIDEDSRKAQADFMRKVLAITSTWPNVHGLALQNMVIGSEELKDISQFRALQILQLDTSSIDAEALRSSNLVPKLRIFSVSGMELEAVTKGLQYPARLSYLAVDQCACSPQSIEYLKTCQKLETVRFTRTNINNDNEVITALAHLPYLRQLQIFNCHLSRKQVETLLGCRTLNRLILSTENCNEAKAAGIKDARLVGFH